MSWLGRGQGREEAELRPASLQDPGGPGMQGLGEAGGAPKRAPALLHRSWIWEVLVIKADTSPRRAVLLCPLGHQWQLTAVMLKSHAASRHEPGCFGKLWWAQHLYLENVVKQGGGEKTTRAWGGGLRHRQGGDAPCWRMASLSCVFRHSEGRRRSPAAAQSYL